MLSQVRHSSRGFALNKYNKVLLPVSGGSYERASACELVSSRDSPQPMTFAGVGVTADGIVLISQPDDEDNVEGRRRVIEELGHDGLHA